MNIGDVVKLKSGGPRMTVEKVTSNVISCVWMDGGSVYRDLFPVITIVIAEDVPKAPQDGDARGYTIQRPQQFSRV